MRALPASLCAAALALAADPGRATAEPGEDPAADGLVFAGVTAADPASAAVNPAALGAIRPGRQIFATMIGTAEQLGITRRAIDPATGAVSDAGTVRDGTLGAGLIIGAISSSRAFTFGLQMVVPPPAETIDDPAVASHTRGSRSRQFGGAAGAAIRVGSRLHFGIWASLTDRRQVVRFARDTALEAGHDPARGVDSDCGGAPCGFGNPAALELWRIEVEPGSLGVSGLIYTVGLMVRVTRGVTIGLAAQRPWESGRYSQVGIATITRAPRDGGEVVVGDAVLHQHLPETYRVGVRAALPRGWDGTFEARLRRLARAEPQNLRVFGTALADADVPEFITLPRGLDDALTLEVGAEQDDTRTWRFGGRLAYDTGPVAAEYLSARGPWAARVSAAVGAQLRRGGYTVQLGYRLDAQPETTTGASAYDPLGRLSCVDADYDYDAPGCAAVRGGFGIATAIGDYWRLGHTVRVTVGFDL